MANDEARWWGSRRAAATARVALAVGAALVAVTPHAADAAAHSGAVTRIPVTFTVSNVNGSALPCMPDDLEYSINGTIVGPAALLRSGTVDVATLYLHELSFGAFFWNFDGVPGYDYATALAEAGHVSVVVDRLGYDASGRPPGRDTCLGAHADITAQIVRALKAGSYTADGRASITFRRIVLAGHSVGGAIAELAITSFSGAGVDGLMLFGWADRDFSQRTIQQGLQEGGDCAQGGEESEPGGQPAYAYFGRTEQEFRDNVFHDTDPRIVALVTPMRNRDPCGDIATLVQISIVNGRRASMITVPVLVLFGENDANFQSSAADSQANSFTESPSVTVRRFAGAGHALTLERAAPSVQRAVAGWLDAQGFAPQPTRVLGSRQRSKTMPATGTSILEMLWWGYVLLGSGILLRAKAPRSHER
jgi:pimeloyl-ACP methyl ester carboxylesterase